MGGQSQFISGSVGNIEISSSNFHLQPDGDVVMSGNVSATSGEIGGFTINAGDLTGIQSHGSNKFTSASLKSNGKIILKNFNSTNNLKELYLV